MALMIIVQKKNKARMEVIFKPLQKEILEVML
jgi:hypothetical protein